MKKLLAIMVLTLSLGLSSLSFADTNVFGVKTPIEKKEVKDAINGGYVAKNLQDTFRVQKLRNKNISISRIDDNKENIRGFRPSLHDKYSFEWYGKI
ncbi:MAG: hypothetical protein GWO07_00700 [Candidatus Dadabacteria bacterium]|nr:hypothetical protein [Candidatus Dadabacteria bacterium]NIS07297.1 hypothetical protein [Candidatus Dadabacteria bacterium]NIY21572.1 hypothetical protein [Candidatus Dadabacteria bacterium]